MKPFVSTVTNKLDAKGRVSVPAPFREILSAQGNAGLYLFPSLRVQALEAAGNELIGRWAERLSGLDPFSEEQDALAEVVLGAAQFVAWDAEGRVKLPDDLLARAGITESITFVGMGDRFRLWNPDAFAAQHRTAMERARQALARPRSGEGAA